MVTCVGTSLKLLTHISNTLAINVALMFVIVYGQIAKVSENV